MFYRVGSIIIYSMILISSAGSETLPTDSIATERFICLKWDGLELEPQRQVILPINNKSMTTKEYDAHIEYALGIDKEGKLCNYDKVGVGVSVKVYTELIDNDIWKIEGKFKYTQMVGWQSLTINGYGLLVPNVRHRQFSGQVSLAENKWHTLQSSLIKNEH